MSAIVASDCLRPGRSDSAGKVPGTRMEASSCRRSCTPPIGNPLSACSNASISAVSSRRMRTSDGFDEKVISSHLLRPRDDTQSVPTCSRIMSKPIFFSSSIRLSFLHDAGEGAFVFALFYRLAFVVFFLASCYSYHEFGQTAVVYKQP